VPLEVREVDPSEAAALGELTVAAYASAPGFGADDAYFDDLADVARRAALARVLVAVDGGTLVGGVTYVPGSGPYAEFDDPEGAGVRMLAVDPAAQGRGVGTALLRACASRARAEGRARLWLHTTPQLAIAQRMYEREGFRRAPENDRRSEDLHLIAYVLDLGEWGRRDSNPH
jgi:ribosomal protein S18 acetylase RimI-like enzyme